MRFVVGIAVLSLLFVVGCGQGTPTKYLLKGFHVDMPLTDLEKGSDWVLGTLKGWDLESPGELNGVAGTFYANEHNGVVTRVKFMSVVEDETNQAAHKAKAEEIVTSFEQQYGESTFPRVHNTNPNVDRIEWLNVDYDLVVTIRDTDLQVEVRNKLARSIEMRDEKADLTASTK